MKFIFHTFYKLTLCFFIFSCLTLEAQIKSTPQENQERIHQINANMTVDTESAALSNKTSNLEARTGNCSDPIMIECGMSLVGNLRDGENNINSYGRGNSNLNGIEIIYAIQVSEPSFVEFNLTNLTADANMVIFTACDNTNAIQTGLFRRGTAPERAVVNLDNQNLYYIAIEAANETVLEGQFTLSASCTPFCASPNGLVETFENGNPVGWQFNVSGSGNPSWRFGDETFGVGIDNAGSGSWASFDDFALGDGTTNNIATAVSPVVNLSGHENVRLFFDYGFDETILVRGDQTRLSITDGILTYYWREDILDWTTQLSPWLDDDDSQILFTADAMFNQQIPEDLDISRLSVTIEYDDGGSSTRSGWGFGFDNFVLCGDLIVTPTNPIVEFVIPTGREELQEGDDLPVVVTATDNVSIANVELFLNDTFVRRENFAPYEWAAQGQADDILRNLVTGTYTLRAVATDNEGNTGENTFTVFVEANTNNERGSFDFGTSTSPLEDGFTRVHPTIAPETFRWLDNSGLNSRNRSTGASVSDLNRDFIFSRLPRTIEVDVPNGDYDVTVTFGDLAFGHDNQQVSAEDGQVIEGDVDTNAGQFVDRSFEVTVSDGSLSLEFSDQGGSNPDWTVTGFTFRQTSLSNVRALKLADTNYTKQENISVGPNPVKDVLFIDGLPNGIYDLMVYSLQGSRVMRQKIDVQQNQQVLNLPFLNTGLYIVRISNGEFTINKKIIRQ